MIYEVIRYDKININWAGEGAVVTLNLRYPEGTHTSTNHHVVCSAGRVHLHAPEAQHLLTTGYRSMWAPKLLERIFLSLQKQQHRKVPEESLKRNLCLIWFTASHRELLPARWPQTVAHSCKYMFKNMLFTVYLPIYYSKPQYSVEKFDQDSYTTCQTK
jgi:hypothetical protein